MVANAKPDFYRDGTLQLVPRWGKYITLFGEVLKNDNSLEQKCKNLAVDIVYIVYNTRCADGLFVGFI
jgi:hypothetical protein